MRYAGLKKNDIVDCEEGICVSLWTQGCPFHCKGCHNPETWDFMGGMKVPHSIFKEINKAINENGIQRNFSVLGGEPLCPAKYKVCERRYTLSSQSLSNNKNLCLDWIYFRRIEK